jgi:hypothetical protein
MNTLNPNSFKGLRNLERVVRDDFFGSKVAPLQSDTLAVDQPNGRNDFKHGRKKEIRDGKLNSLI